MSDAERNRWLRRVQTAPADFLRAKFAYQAAMKDGNHEASTTVSPATFAARHRAVPGTTPRP